MYNELLNEQIYKKLESIDFGPKNDPFLHSECIPQSFLKNPDFLRPLILTLASCFQFIEPLVESDFQKTILNINKIHGTYFVPWFKFTKFCDAKKLRHQ